MLGTRFGGAPGDCSAAILRGDGLDGCYMFNRLRSIDGFTRRFSPILMRTRFKIQYRLASHRKLARSIRLAWTSKFP